MRRSKLGHVGRTVRTAAVVAGLIGAFGAAVRVRAGDDANRPVILSNNAPHSGMSNGRDCEACHLSQAPWRIDPETAQLPFRLRANHP
jgi:hypothetical protein